MGCRPKFSQEVRDRAVELVRSGMSQTNAAKTVGCGHTVISHWVREAGGVPYIKSKRKPRKPHKPTHADKDKSRRAYLARLMRDALPGAIRKAREEMRRLEDT